MPGLDHVLAGGFPADHIYLLTGPSGSGKTTFGLQFLIEGARRGDKSLYIGTSEFPEEIREIGRSHGWNLSGIELRYHGGLEALTGKPKQTMFQPVEVELPRTMEALMAIVNEVNPDRLVIDSLTEIRLLSGRESWYRDQLKVLQRHFSDKPCTVLLTDLNINEQPVVRSIVHGVIELGQTSPVYGPDRRRLRVAKLRGTSYCTGYHDFTICKGGLRIFPRLIAAEHRQRFKPEMVSSGLPELDKLLGGGLDRGTSTLFVGPTGTGKSTILTQYVTAAARRGEKCAMYIFDERIQTLFQRSAGLGMELEEHVNSGTVTVLQVDPAEMTPGEFSTRVMNDVEKGVQIIAIDSLNGYAYAMPEERMLDVHLHELLSYLNRQAVTSLQVMTQHGIFSSASAAFDVSYISDTVILMRMFEYRGAVHRSISVHKRRAGDHENTIREFTFKEGSIQIGKPLTQFTGVISGNPQFLGEELEEAGGNS